MSLFPHYLRDRLLAPDSTITGGGKPRAQGLDLNDPLDNLYAFGNLWATYAQDPVFSAFHGLMFGMVPGQRLRPLFGYAGFGGFQARLLTNGNVRLRGKETGFFTDLAGGEVLEHWDNPSTGEYINPSEHFTFFSSWQALADRDIPCASFQCGFSRLSPWWPWMRMGGSGIEGALFGRMHSHKSNRGFSDIPAAILAYAQQHHPEYLQACEDWDDGSPIGTWEAYARSVPPEVEN